MSKKYLLIAIVVSLCITPFSASASPQQSLSLTLGKSTQDLTGVSNNLSGLGYTALSQTGNNRDKAWKLNYQQPMPDFWSVNVGWVDLGGNNIQLNSAIPAGKTNTTAASEVAASLPVRGWGLSLIHI